jgi:hypothetical protein
MGWAGVCETRVINFENGSIFKSLKKLPERGLSGNVIQIENLQYSTKSNRSFSLPASIGKAASAYKSLPDSPENLRDQSDTLNSLTF